MQSGKTGTIKHLCNLILPEIGFLKENESVMFLTSMRDTDLRDQNVRSLEAEDSNIFVVPMHKFQRYGLKDVQRYNVKLIIRDEDQYGAGKESSFDDGFFKNVRVANHSIPLLSVSATPFDIIQAASQGLDVEVILGERNPSYYGITEMLYDKSIIDLPDKYNHLRATDNGKKTLSYEIQNSISHLKSFSKGVGIIRASKTKEAILLKEEILKIHRNIEVVVVGCQDDCDLPIRDGIKLIPRKIKFQEVHVILIVINALSAGKDLKALKESIRFVIETRKTQLANCAQGLPGRCCGYHNNRDIMIYANKTILEHFADFENNPEVMYDEEWVNELFFDEKVRSLSSQTKFQLEQKEGEFFPVTKTYTISIEDLFSAESEEILSFMNQEKLGKLALYFEESCYDQKQRVGGLGDTNIQLRVASNYIRNNAVYRYWNRDTDDNFKSIFVHNRIQNKYGILLSNFPVSDPRNDLGFCGIKVFESGEMKYQKRMATTLNQSMYSAIGE